MLSRVRNRRERKGWRAVRARRSVIRSRGVLHLRGRREVFERVADGRSADVAIPFCSKRGSETDLSEWLVGVTAGGQVSACQPHKVPQTISYTFHDCHCHRRIVPLWRFCTQLSTQ